MSTHLIGTAGTGLIRTAGTGALVAALALASTVPAMAAAASDRPGDGPAPGAVRSLAASARLTGLAELDEVSRPGALAQGLAAPDESALLLVDVATGVPTAVAPGTSFVRDNPALRLEVQHAPGEPGNAVSAVLVNAATATSVRIDTDGAGVPLVAAWTAPVCDDECRAFSWAPGIFLGPESVSTDGSMVAFCANLADQFNPTLYVKNTVTGQLTHTGVRCGVYDTGDVLTYPIAPEISASGSVVHVNGDTAKDDDDAGTNLANPITTWSADSLYFTASGTVRLLNGWGSMTRDGRSVFLRIGVRPPGLTSQKARVGAYSVKTKVTKRLPGTTAIYGTDLFYFRAANQASDDGKRVIHFGTGVINRSNGTVSNLGWELAQQGYAYDSEDAMDRPSLISGDGKVAFLPVSASADATRPAQYVALSGWVPTAFASVTAVDGQSRLSVDVDPDRGGFWGFRVQRMRADGSWATLGGVYGTRGWAETRTLNLAAGTYRIQVKPKYGYRGSLSGEVVLVR